VGAKPFGATDDDIGITYVTATYRSDNKSFRCRACIGQAARQLTGQQMFADRRIGAAAP